MIENIIEPTSRAGRKYPDMVIGIGGTGKRIVKSMLSSEWLIEDIINEYKKENDFQGTKFRIIDSDKGQGGDDRKDLEVIRDFINKKGNRNDYADNIFGLNIENSYVDISLSSSAELTSPDFKGHIKKNRNFSANVWWIDDEEKGLKNFANLVDADFQNARFTNGVNRRRMLSKALMYYYLSAMPIEENPLLLTGSGRYIAIVVALGGGTGSGTFIDLANFLKQKMQNCSLTLFAILPTASEHQNEHANAYTALSELEKSEIFDYINLIPIDHSGYGGGDVEDSTAESLNEFYQVFPYNFAATYDRIFKDDEDIKKKIPYQKFIVTSGFIVRYAARSLLDKSVKARNAVNSLIDYCNKENDLRNKITDLINNVSTNVELSHEDGILDNKLNEFKNVFLIKDKNEDESDPVSEDDDKNEFLVGSILRSAEYIVVDHIYTNYKYSELDDEFLKVKSGVDAASGVELNGDNKELLNTARIWLDNISKYENQINFANTSDLFDVALRDAFKRLIKCTPLFGDISTNLEKKETEYREDISQFWDELKALDKKIETLEVINKVNSFLEKCRDEALELIENNHKIKKTAWLDRINQDSIAEYVADEVFKELKYASDYYRLKVLESYYNKSGFFRIKRSRKKANASEKRIDEIVNKLKILIENPEDRNIFISEKILEHIPYSDKKMDIKNTHLPDLMEDKSEIEHQIADRNKNLIILQGLNDLKDQSNEVKRLENEYKKRFKEILNIERKKYGTFIHEVYPEELELINSADKKSDIRILANGSGNDLINVNKKITDLFRQYIVPDVQKGFNFSGTRQKIKSIIDDNERYIGINGLRVINFSLENTTRHKISDVDQKKIYELYGIKRDYNNIHKNIIENNIKIADKWDNAVVSMFFFLPIEMLKNSNIYFHAYKDMHLRDGLKGVIPHHAMGLEDGVFFRRERIFEDNEVIELAGLKDNSEIQKKLDDIYQDINLREVIGG